jgi:Bifunctional DNA primase/polymerase, N-terminal/Primase C terminal 1 (PriCT-1)
VPSPSPFPAQVAVELAERGRPVFPCWPGTRKPLTKHGYLDASRDLARIRDWWSRWPDANVGMPTGQVSWVVLDVDPRHGGGDSLHELKRDHGELPPRFSVKTPSGGLHLYFRWPGVSVQNSVGRVGPGLDIRGDGGYVLVPPSQVDGRRYEVDNEVPVAPMPDWLLERARERPLNGNGRVPASQWARIAQGVDHGQRNDTVARVMGHLLGKGVDPPLARALVVGWNQRFNRPPTPESEVIKTCNSIMRAELRGWEGVA